MLSDLFARLAATRRVAIDRCYHYRGFRYGGFGNNPYEDYIVGLARGDSVSRLRRTFADIILHCCPKDMSEALQLELGSMPLWHYPWHRRQPQRSISTATPHENPDVVCHYCDAGILASHINREFRWLHAAYENIRTKGYRPHEFGHIRCLELAAEAESSYLVLDGNHRLSALHALGKAEVTVKLLPLRRVRRQDASTWPMVRNGTVDLKTALRVFDRYFATSNPPLRRLRQATLIVDEPPLWPPTAAELEVPAAE